GGWARPAVSSEQRRQEPLARAGRDDPARVAARFLATGRGTVRRGAGVLMVRRSLGVALWTVVGLLACFLGALSALVSTGAGRALVARVTEDALRRVFTGSAEVGGVHGALLPGRSRSAQPPAVCDRTLS